MIPPGSRASPKIVRFGPAAPNGEPQTLFDPGCALARRVTCR